MSIASFWTKRDMVIGLVGEHYAFFKTHDDAEFGTNQIGPTMKQTTIVKKNGVMIHESHAVKGPLLGILLGWRKYRQAELINCSGAKALRIGFQYGID